ncbi:unnamed protein product [Pylaiella littoralis]
MLGFRLVLGGHRCCIVVGTLASPENICTHRLSALKARCYLARVYRALLAQHHFMRTLRQGLSEIDGGLSTVRRRACRRRSRRGDPGRGESRCCTYRWLLYESPSAGGQENTSHAVCLR